MKSWNCWRCICIFWGRRRAQLVSLGADGAAVGVGTLGIGSANEWD